MEIILTNKQKHCHCLTESVISVFEINKNQNRIAFACEVYSFFYLSILGI